MDKIVNFLTNRYLLAVIALLFLLSILKRFSAR